MKSFLVALALIYISPSFASAKCFYNKLQERVSAMDALRACYGNKFESKNSKQEAQLHDFDIYEGPNACDYLYELNPNKLNNVCKTAQDAYCTEEDLIYNLNMYYGTKAVVCKKTDEYKTVIKLLK